MSVTKPFSGSSGVVDETGVGTDEFYGRSIRVNHMADILTGVRILCGIIILCCPAFSGWFYSFYLLGGFTDAIDGTVARKMGQASDFGAKFDTVADFVFAITVVVKLIRALYIPLWLMTWMVLIALVKIGCHLAGYMKHHELRTVHSVLNKICGGVVFVVPLLIGESFPWQAKAVLLIAVCILTSVAAIREGVAILRN